MKISGYLLLAVLLLAPGLQAETLGIPKIEEQKMSLTCTNTAAQEMMVNRLMTLTGTSFDGTIRLAWADEACSYAARQLRLTLIAKGIRPERILLSQRRAGNPVNAITDVEVSIRHIVMRLPECDYAAQSYRFNNNASLGCAVNNTRSSAIINLNDFLF